MKALLLALVGSALSLAACSSSGDGDTDDAGQSSTTSSGGSSSGDHGSKYPSCAAISEACHGGDDGNPGPIHDCHELAHDDSASEPSCFVAKDDCLAICTGDGGTHDDDGGHGH